jgi:hypothetical protein
VVCVQDKIRIAWSIGHPKLPTGYSLKILTQYRYRMRNAAIGLRILGLAYGGSARGVGPMGLLSTPQG